MLLDQMYHIMVITNVTTVFLSNDFKEQTSPQSLST